MPRLDQIADLEKRFLLPTYNRYPMGFERGKGVFLYDFEGKKYLDFVAGLGVNALGHAHPRIVKAIREQAARVIHLSNLYYNEYQGLLAERLCQLSGLDRVFFSNSGTEAMEGAIKLARLAGHKAGGGSKSQLVALQGSYHGRTFGAMSLTGQEKYRKGFEPLLDDVTFVAQNDIAALDTAVNANTCAIVLEPIFAGVPLGAFLSKEHFAAAISPGQHGTTFGGGPLACRVALEYLAIVEEEHLLENVVKVGAYLHQQLQELVDKYAATREARGRGFIQGLVLDIPARPLVEQALGEGVLFNSTQDTVLRFLPPFLLEEKHVDKGIRVLKKLLGKKRKKAQNAASVAA